MTPSLPAHPFGWLPVEIRRRVFVALALLAIALTLLMNALGAPLRTAAAPLGIISYEFAGTIPAASDILSSWGPRGQALAGLSLGLDFLYIVAYASTISLGCVLVAQRWLDRSRWMAVFGVALSWAVLVAGLLDVIENVALIQVLLGSSSESWPVLARWCAAGKFAIVGLGLAYVVIGGVVVWALTSARAYPAV